MPAVAVSLIALLAALLALVGWRWVRRSAGGVEADSAEGSPHPAYQARLFSWFHRLHFPPVAFYAELWRDPREDPSFPALAEKYGEEKAESEAGWLQTHLPREVVTVAAGLLYTLGRIEAILAELQTYIDEHVERWPEGKPLPEFGQGVSHPLVMEASFEFVNFLGWLRAIDERLDRPYRPGSKERAGLIPGLADRPLRARVEELVTDFRAKTLERRLANYVMHAGAVPQPMEGASLSQEHRVSLRIPDRPTEQVSTRWHLTYDEERDALTLAREAAEAVELLVDGLLDAFEKETRAVEKERERRRR